jgi:hypothetical protein
MIFAKYLTMYHYGLGSSHVGVNRSETNILYIRKSCIERNEEILIALSQLLTSVFCNTMSY